MKTKRVRVISNLTDVHKTYHSGEVCEIDEAVADQWVAAELAEAVSAHTPLGLPETTPAETATAQGESETATQPRSKIR